MSHTIAHRPHVHHHVPLTPVFAVIVAIAVAAVVIWAINQPRTTPVGATGGGAIVPASITQPAEVPAARSAVVRHAQMRVLLRGEPAQVYLARSLHRIEGATLDSLSTATYTTHSAPVYQKYRYKR